MYPAGYMFCAPKINLHVSPRNMRLREVLACVGVLLLGVSVLWIDASVRGPQPRILITLNC